MTILKRIGYVISLISLCISHNNAADTPPIKPYTVIFYVAADNNLHRFASQKLRSLATLGSNNNVNFCMHVDVTMGHKKKKTFRYYFDHNKSIIHTNKNDPLTQKMDSGNPQTLVSCCQWAVTHYPAQNYILILWNHGSGIIDPLEGRITITDPNSPVDLPPSIINKYIKFSDFITDTHRGICFDDSARNYLNNQTFEAALQEIKTTLLNGKKFSIIGFDACLMGALEVANIIKDYAEFMIASEEIEWAPGWQWTRSFQPLRTQPLSPLKLSQHIISTYGKTNGNRSRYTLSAIDLQKVQPLEDVTNHIADLLLYCLIHQKNNTVFKAIANSRHKKNCMFFDEPAYLDLYHLYQNMLKNLNNFKLTNEDEEKTIKEELNTALLNGCRLTQEAVAANVTSKPFKNARGISIYFPHKGLHPSYPKTKFAIQNESWLQFIKLFSLLQS